MNGPIITYYIWNNLFKRLLDLLSGFWCGNDTIECSEYQRREWNGRCSCALGQLLNCQTAPPQISPPIALFRAQLLKSDLDVLNDRFPHFEAKEGNSDLNRCSSRQNGQIVLDMWMQQLSVVYCVHCVSLRAAQVPQFECWAALQYRWIPWSWTKTKPCLGRGADEVQMAHSYSQARYPNKMLVSLEKPWK